MTGPRTSFRMLMNSGFAIALILSQPPVISKPGRFDPSLPGLTVPGKFAMNWIMRRAATLAFLLVIASASAEALVRFEVGGLIGTRTVNSALIRDVYGTGTFLYPYVTIHPWRGLFIGAGYEGGSTRSGKIGIYSEATTLRISGFEIFAGYEIPVGMIVPFLKAGYASYSYKQFIDSEFVEPNQVDASKGTFVLGGGLKAFMSGAFYLSGEIRLVPLKVQPFDTEVDLGGLRYAAGIGVKF